MKIQLNADVCWIKINYSDGRAAEIHEIVFALPANAFRDSHMTENALVVNEAGNIVEVYLCLP